MMKLRCAVYTRKSTEDGLEQAFNSLDAQREACEAYIRSQASEGWTCLEGRYDDGGFSGGSMNRPGLQKLLGDLDRGQIDVVVVYKVDRLTRSLLDFARIIEKLDSQNVSFVSVTQSFNTTSSMGRLTLNVLLSFAQFEREVTAERIRDKIAASKKKGMWMGGVVPLGYDLKDRRLYINQTEANTVQWLFETYLDLKNVKHLAQAAREQGLFSKRYVQASGRTVGGHPFSRGQLAYLLRNPLYIGKVRHKDKVYNGEHDALIGPDLWEKVQSLLDANGPGKNRHQTIPSPSWAAGLLHDDTGERMIASHTSKGGRRYRYYISVSLRDRKTDSHKGWRLPARQVEDIILTGILDLLKDPVRLLKMIGDTALTSTRLDRANSFCTRLSGLLKTAREQHDADTFKDTLCPLLHRIDISLYEINITLDPVQLQQQLGWVGSQNNSQTRGPKHTSHRYEDQRHEGLEHNDHEHESLDHKAGQHALAEYIDEIDGMAKALIPHRGPDAPTPRIIIPVQLKRRGVEMRIVMAGQQTEPKPTDEALARLVARAHCWFEELKSGKTPKVQDIARREKMYPADVSRILPLAFLAPDIVTAILEGTQPVDLTAWKLKRLKDLPLDWQAQRELLGFT